MYVFSADVPAGCPHALEYQTPPPIPLDLKITIDAQPFELVQFPPLTEVPGGNGRLNGVNTSCIELPPSKPTLAPFGSTSETLVFEPNEAEPPIKENSEIELLLIKYVCHNAGVDELHPGSTEPSALLQLVIVTVT